MVAKLICSAERIIEINETRGLFASYAPAIVPTHCNESIGVSKSYDRSILEHANKPKDSMTQIALIARALNALLGINHETFFPKFYS